jgi:hypothetical protein
MMGVTICIFALSYISSFFETEQETFKLKQRVEYKSETPSTKNEWQRQKISQRTTYNPFENEVTVKVKRNYGYHKDKYEVEVLNDNRPTKELEESEVMEAVDFYRD